MAYQKVARPSWRCRVPAETVLKAAWWPSSRPARAGSAAGTPNYALGAVVDLETPTSRGSSPRCQPSAPTGALPPRTASQHGRHRHVRQLAAQQLCSAPAPCRPYGVRPQLRRHPALPWTWWQALSTQRACAWADAPAREHSWAGLDGGAPVRGAPAGLRASSGAATHDSFAADPSLQGLGPPWELSPAPAEGAAAPPGAVRLQCPRRPALPC